MVFLATGWARLTYVTHIIETLYCMTVIIHVSVPFLFVYLTIFVLCLSLSQRDPVRYSFPLMIFTARFLHYRNSKPYNEQGCLQRESFQLLADGEKKAKANGNQACAKLRERKQGAGICFLFFSHSYLGSPETLIIDDRRSLRFITELRHNAIRPPFFTA